VNYGPRPISFTLLYRFTITHSVYFTCILLSFYHSIRSILCSQQTGEIDNLIEVGSKVLGCVVLCWGFTLLLGEDAPAFSGDIVWSITKLASITFWSLAFSYWFDKPWFHNWGKLAAVLLIPSSWGSQLGALTSHYQVCNRVERQLTEFITPNKPEKQAKPPESHKWKKPPL
jgi:hypothetical protein